MTLTIPDEVRAKAEIYLGDAAGQEKTRLLLHEIGLPSGLLPLRDIIECGYVEETGFVCSQAAPQGGPLLLRESRPPRDLRRRGVGGGGQGPAEEDHGVKAKEMLIWVTLHEICVDDPPQGKLHCKAIGGLSRSFPVEAFEADDGRVVVPRNVGGVGGGGAAAAAGNGNGAAAEAVEKKVEAAAEGEKKAAVAEEGSKGDKDAAGVDKVEEKLKETSTAEQVVQGEAVAAKN
ncbi:unnamed protein product [Miscanthus lutarioriparius]|uniref:Uncharacterized protein n=1 Tax=Miscanthus lutarioriparius TaxID=422564 RepID=A0A811RIP6_9POAL|nr:unnamed protein product [Miscanthus lutarioriparius]